MKYSAYKIKFKGHYADRTGLLPGKSFIIHKMHEIAGGFMRVVRGAVR